MKKIIKKIFDYEIAAMFWLTLVVLIGAAINAEYLRAYGNTYLGIPNYIVGIYDILFAIILALLIEKFIIPGKKGEFNLENFWKGMFLVLPVLLWNSFNNIIAGIKQGMTLQSSFSLLIAAVISGAAPGIVEEICVRGLPLLNCMRAKCTEKRIPVYVIISSTIFSLLHAINLLSGMDIGKNLNQLFYTFAIGMVFGAVYLRCGSILPCIAAHFAMDFTAYILGLEDVKQQQSTASVVTGTFFNEYIVRNIPYMVMIIFAVFLIRKSKRGEICELWDNKLHDQTGL